MTRRLEGTLVPSLEGATCGLTWRLAAPIWAGHGLASLSICHCWLPNWLPAIRQTSIRVPQSAGPVEWRLSFTGQLRHLATNLVTIRDPKATTPRPGPAYLEHGRPGSAVGAPRPTSAERRAASSPPSQHGTRK